MSTYFIYLRVYRYHKTTWHVLFVRVLLYLRISRLFFLASITTYLFMRRAGCIESKRKKKIGFLKSIKVVLFFEVSLLSPCQPSMLRFLPRIRTSSSFFSTTGACLKHDLYASSSSPNKHSALGCVLPKARSKTYKSTARSSSCTPPLASPRSIMTISPLSPSALSDGDVGGLSIMLLVVRSP